MGRPVSSRVHPVAFRALIAASVAAACTLAPAGCAVKKQNPIDAAEAIIKEVDFLLRGFKTADDVEAAQPKLDAFIQRWTETNLALSEMLRANPDKYEAYSKSFDDKVGKAAVRLGRTIERIDRKLPEVSEKLEPFKQSFIDATEEPLRQVAGDAAGT